MARLKKGSIYKYEHGKYVREKLADRRGCTDYRIIPVKERPGRKLLICITEKKGPRGGRTKAVALLRSLKTEKGKALAKRAITKQMR